MQGGLRVPHVVVDHEQITAWPITVAEQHIASDHVPRDEESKRLPFAEAAAGGVGLNTLLPISLELYHNGHLGLLDVFRLITQAPADLLNLPAGRLEAGRPADLLVFDPDRGWKVDAKTLLSQAKNSPFDRRPPDVVEQ